jgi:hypothetical protein
MGVMVYVWVVVLLLNVIPGVGCYDDIWVGYIVECILGEMGYWVGYGVFFM